MAGGLKTVRSGEKQLRSCSRQSGKVTPKACFRRSFERRDDGLASEILLSRWEARGARRAEGLWLLR